MTTPEETTQGKKFFSPRNMVYGALGVVLLLVIVAAGWWGFNLLTSTKVNATFTSAVGIYDGSNVRVLGVDVGKVTKVTPNGKNVDVEMRINRGVKLPADVHAAQIIPSIVADRYVQLFPAYSGGPEAKDGIHLGTDRSQVPVEIDAIYANLQKLSKSLGPDGVNTPKGGKGALDDFVKTAANNLDGNGEKLGAAIANLSKAAGTLSNSRGNLADTIQNLDVFVGALRENDAQVRTFNTQMQSFNNFMAGERQQLGQALDTLSYALGDVAKFVNDNSQQLGDTIRDLQPTGQALLDNRKALLEVVTQLPLVINNLINSYDAESGTVAMRVNLPELQDPIGAQCKLLDLGNLLPGNPLAKDFSNKIRPLVDGCKDIGKQITNDVLEPMLPILPFGILSGNKLQNMQPPGAVPGNPDPAIPGGN